MITHRWWWKRFRSLRTVWSPGTGYPLLQICSFQWRRRQSGTGTVFRRRWYYRPFPENLWSPDQGGTEEKSCFRRERRCGSSRKGCPCGSCPYLPFSFAGRSHLFSKRTESLFLRKKFSVQDWTAERISAGPSSIRLLTRGFQQNLQYSFWVWTAKSVFRHRRSVSGRAQRGSGPRYRSSAACWTCLTHTKKHRLRSQCFLFLSAGGNRSRKLFLRQYVFFLRSSYRLALYDCFCRTNTCACSAVYTCISVDHILAVSLRNCLYRTFASACSAAYALVSNYICHVFFLLLLFSSFDVRFWPFRQPFTIHGSAAFYQVLHTF